MLLRSSILELGELGDSAIECFTLGFYLHGFYRQSYKEETCCFHSFAANMCWMEMAVSRGNKDGVSNHITLDSHSYKYRDTPNITVKNVIPVSN